MRLYLANGDSRWWSLPWVSAGVVLAAALVTALPGAGPALEYDRARVAAGEVWRLATAQLVHWTPRMALADLGVILVLGAWLESRGRRRAVVLALALAAGLALAGVAVALPHLARYRGSSGPASALLVLAALEIARPPSRRGERALALLALALFAVKVTWETVTGQALFAGRLPVGVDVAPLAHLLGGVAGAVVFGLRRSRAVLGHRPGPFPVGKTEGRTQIADPGDQDAEPQ